MLSYNNMVDASVLCSRKYGFDISVREYPKKYVAWIHGETHIDKSYPTPGKAKYLIAAGL
jgi:hypothetical protein